MSMSDSVFFEFIHLDRKELTEEIQDLKALIKELIYCTDHYADENNIEHMVDSRGLGIAIRVSELPKYIELKKELIDVE